MKKFRYILTVVVGLLAIQSIQADGTGEVLWWMVEEDDENPQRVVDWYGTPSTISEIGANSARLRAEDASGTVTYLDFYVLNPYTDDFEEWPGLDGAAIPVWAYADVSGMESYSFAVELGNWENGEWVKTLVDSEPVPYDNLQAHIKEWDGIDPIDSFAWIPSAYSVPEPSSGLLVLLGGAFMALRRRRNVGSCSGTR